jgi:hypothetical protein
MKSPAFPIIHFRVSTGSRWLHRVLWLEQIDGPTVLPRPVAFSSLDSALAHACEVSDNRDCSVIVERRGGVRDEIALHPSLAA